RLDARVEIRPAAKRPLKTNDRIRFFIGTAEVLGRAIVLEESGEIAVKQSGLAQIVLQHPVVALAGDRFVLRNETSQRTIGGGIVLNPTGRRIRKPLAIYRERLAALSGGRGPDAIEALLNLQDSFAVSTLRVAQMLNAPIAEVEAALKDSRFIKFSLGDEEGFATRVKWDEVKRFAADAIAAHHRAEPLAPGLEMEALRTRLPYEVGARAFRALIDRISRESEIVREESVLRLKSHRVELGGDDGRLGADIERVMKEAGFHPPDLKQLAEALKLPAGREAKLKSLLAALERQGRLVKIASDLYFDRGALEAARSRLVEHLKSNEQITAAGYRDLLGASRKFAIALLDYFDHSGVTTRVGDARRLRQSIAT
ncbi:MAG: SelB C-terminal domain-containing protein, partial [Candidatus Binataceae bacterium]